MPRNEHSAQPAGFEGAGNQNGTEQDAVINAMLRVMAERNEHALRACNGELIRGFTSQLPYEGTEDLGALKTAQKNLLWRMGDSPSYVIGAYQSSMRTNRTNLLLSSMRRFWNADDKHWIETEQVNTRDYDSWRSSTAVIAGREYTQAEIDDLMNADGSFLLTSEDSHATLVRSPYERFPSATNWLTHTVLRHTVSDMTQRQSPNWRGIRGGYSLLSDELSMGDGMRTGDVSDQMMIEFGVTDSLQNLAAEFDLGDKLSELTETWQADRAKLPI